MKTNNQAFNLLASRAFTYISVFIIGAAIHELCFQLIYPRLWSSGSLSLTVFTLIAFVLVGVLITKRGQLLSQAVSASTLLVLGFIALRIGHASASDPYLLIIALVVATVGAKPAFHRDPATAKQIALYSLFSVVIAVVISAAFTYSMLVLDRITLQ